MVTDRIENPANRGREITKIYTSIPNTNNVYSKTLTIEEYDVLKKSQIRNKPLGKINPDLDKFKLEK